MVNMVYMFLFDKQMLCCDVKVLGIKKNSW